jgi:tetratricopeptide (TPR) repeat protein
MKGKIPTYEKKLILSMIQYEGVQYEEGLKIAIGVESHLKCKFLTSFDMNFSALSNDEKGMLFYLKGIHLKGLEKFDESILQLEKAVQLEKLLEKEQYIIPHCLVELAEIYLDKKNLKKSFEFLEKAKNYSDFDFDKPLLRRIKNLFDKLKSLQTTSS